MSERKRPVWLEVGEFPDDISNEDKLILPKHKFKCGICKRRFTSNISNPICPFCNSKYVNAMWSGG